MLNQQLNHTRATMPNSLKKITRCTWHSSNRKRKLIQPSEVGVAYSLIKLPLILVTQTVSSFKPLTKYSKLNYFVSLLMNAKKFISWSNVQILIAKL